MWAFFENKQCNRSTNQNHNSPGWTFTSLTGANSLASKPAGAWSATETVQYMLDKVRSGEFYILVPDNDTKREVDQLRIMWAAADIAEGRPALSRWDVRYKALYEEYMREGLAQLEWSVGLFIVCGGRDSEKDRKQSNGQWMNGLYISFSVVGLRKGCADGLPSIHKSNMYFSCYKVNVHQMQT